MRQAFWAFFMFLILGVAKGHTPCYNGLARWGSHPKSKPGAQGARAGAQEDTMSAFEKKVTVTRIGGSWSMKGEFRTMTLMEAINWFNKYGYKLSWARDRRDGGRNLTFRKPGCNTEYHMVIPA